MEQENDIRLGPTRVTRAQLLLLASLLESPLSETELRSQLGRGGFGLSKRDIRQFVEHLEELGLIRTQDFRRYVGYFVLRERCCSITEIGRRAYLAALRYYWPEHASTQPDAHEGERK